MDREISVQGIKQAEEVREGLHAKFLAGKISYYSVGRDGNYIVFMSSDRALKRKVIKITK